METVRVACAILVENGMILLAQRSERMAHPLQWEFPGGKLQGSETPEAGLARELLEELGIGVRILRALAPAVTRLGGTELVLHPFVCEVAHGRPTPHEHRALLWTAPEEAGALDLLAADRPILEGYLRRGLRRPQAEGAGRGAG